MGKGSSSSAADAFPGNVREAKEVSRLQESALDRALQRTTELNLFDTQTPFGSREFTGTPGAPDFQQTETLSPFRQGLLDFGQQQFGGFQDLLSGPAGGEDLSQARGDVEGAVFERGRNLLQPGFDRDQSRLENNLIQRGIPRSSEAFQTEQGFQDQAQGQALENLALSSVQAGGAEQSRLISEDLRRRQEALGQLSFLGGGGQAPPSQFQPVATFGQEAPNTLGAFGLLNQNQAAQNAAQGDKKAGASGAVGTLGSVAGIAALASSKEWKADKQEAPKVLEKLDQLPVETWCYEGQLERHIGPYAEDFQELFGYGDGKGIPIVDALGICFKAIKELSAQVRELKHG